jgi:hypothetical protein
MIIHIEREYKATQTNGVLYCDGLVLQTLERPWLNNKAFDSCIPEGHYQLSPWVSPKFGNCYIVDGMTVGKTSGIRTHILVHPANWVKQLNGCIALGIGWSGDMLLNSKQSCQKLFDKLNGKVAKLVISKR